MDAIIIGVNHQDNFEILLEELYALCERCSLSIQHTFIQKGSIHPSTYIGKGKIEEVLEYIHDDMIVVCFHELTPSQLRNLTDSMQVPIVDRTDIILKIFDECAHTKEAHLQVKIARLRYELPRLIGHYTKLYSQQGGKGFRGSGETQLELERRHIRAEIKKTEKELQKLKKERQIQRHQRHSTFSICLVGYTNAGKSTIMNMYTNKQVYEQDELFATLETSSRKVLINTTPVILSDTVGFISELPHQLIEAFHSTLEELTEADLILHVIDSSSHYYDTQITVTDELLKELNVHAPILYVYNKTDKSTHIYDYKEPYVCISAKNKRNIDVLNQKIIELLYKDYLLHHVYLTYDRIDEIQGLLQYPHIINIDYQDKGIEIQYYKKEGINDEKTLYHETRTDII